MKKFLVVGLVLCLLFTAVLGYAADPVPPKGFGNRAIKIIVPFAAGGGTDTTCRMYAEAINKKYGVTIVIENVAGGSGAVGLTKCLASRADGYALSIVSTGVQSLFAQNLFNYKPKDVTFINQLMGYPAILVTMKNGKYSTYDQLINAAKANPGTIKMGHNGTLNSSHAITIALGRAYNDDNLFMSVPFDGASRALTELLGGHIDAMVCAPGDIMSQIDQLEVLTVLGEESELFPGTPAIYEYGLTPQDFPNIGYVRQYIVGPANMDEEVVSYLSALFAGAMETDDLKNFGKTRAYEFDNARGADLQKNWDEYYAGVETWVAFFK